MRRPKWESMPYKRVIRTRVCLRCWFSPLQPEVQTVKSSLLGQNGLENVNLMTSNSNPSGELWPIIHTHMPFIAFGTTRPRLGLGLSWSWPCIETHRNCVAVSNSTWDVWCVGLVWKHKTLFKHEVNPSSFSLGSSWWVDNVLQSVLFCTPAPCSSPSYLDTPCHQAPVSCPQDTCSSSCQ